ncbi:SBBP repeat-containing protein [Saccharicrinis sp. FJH2]|uniref:SBBP repeat-containing protein n=1 Tax=Saccharicrinis sp. FJH65 TaxID=3344659 RepID=UPI0035F3865F
MKNSILVTFILLSIVLCFNNCLSAQDLSSLPNAYSSYLGGSSADQVNSVQIDKDGFLYIAGSTMSDNFPVTENAFSTHHMGDLDAYVVKIDINTNKIIWATYIGGTSVDYLGDMEIDNQGNVYIIGNTLSSDFPTSENAYDRNFNGASGGNHGDLYIAKLSNDGSRLLFSTYLGGSGTESYENLELDKYGNIYVCSSTSSTDYPITPNALNNSFNGYNSGSYLADIAISKFSNQGKLLYSTYFGGRGNETGKLIIDDDLNMILAGQSSSNDLPVTDGSYFTSSDTTSGRNGANLFLAVIDSSGKRINHCTYLKGNSPGFINTVIFKDDKNLLLGGSTTSSDLPVSKNAFQKEYHNDQDAFVMEYSLVNNKVNYCTYIGGSNKDICTSIAKTNDGNLLITGTSLSEDFPVTSNSFDASYNGASGSTWGGDYFISIINSAMGTQEYSTYLGGTGNDYWPRAIVNDDKIYIVGNTKSNDFPVTEHALFKNYGGEARQGGDVVFLRFSIDELLNYPLTSDADNIKVK